MWTKREDEFLINNSSLTYQELAQKLNKTYDQIKHRKQKLGLTSSLQTNTGGYKMKCPHHKTYKGKNKPKNNCEFCWRIYLDNETPEIKVEKDIRLHQETTQRKELSTRYKTLLRKVRELEREKEALLTITKTPQSIKIKPRHRSKSEATAFIIASDWHFEERVEPETVSGLNEYNLDIARKRINNFFSNSLRLFKIFEKDIRIETIVFALLGDFISSTIHDELKEGNQLLPADAIWEVQNLLIAGIDFLLDNTKVKFVIPCHSGNHGRMTKKQRIATEAGNSLEAFMYNNLALRYQGEDRVKFIVARGYHTYLDVYNYTIRLHHGHAIRYNGGVGGIYIPVNKAINQWNKARKAHLDIFGHFHQRRDGGNFISNGSIIGYNSFSINIKAEFEKPQQSFFLLDKKRGKTIVAPILVE